MNGLPLQSILELISQIKVLLDESYGITCRGYDPSKIVGRYRALLTIRCVLRRVAKFIALNRASWQKLSVRRWPKRSSKVNFDGSSR